MCVLFDAFLGAGCSFFVGVPDSTLAGFSAAAASATHMVAANEGNAVGIAIGHHLATGSVPVVYMQNSGLGNALNPVLSLADSLVYGIPMVVVVGWRGAPGVEDEPQHRRQGLVTADMIRACGYECEVLDRDEARIGDQAARMVRSSVEHGQPVFLLVDRTFGGVAPVGGSRALTRRQALVAVVDRIDPDALVVSTTGRLSRELFEYRESMGMVRGDFLVVGGMGHCSQIALGVALATSRRVYCLDGDGSVLMHMGGMATVGAARPRNLTHIVFNNGRHESVGGQETCNPAVDLVGVARACGYPLTFRTGDPWGFPVESDDLCFVELVVGVEAPRSLPRPPVSKANFMGRI